MVQEYKELRILDLSIYKNIVTQFCLFPIENTLLSVHPFLVVLLREFSVLLATIMTHFLHPIVSGRDVLCPFPQLIDALDATDIILLQHLTKILHHLAFYLPLVIDRHPSRRT